jgi:hypothetical protein
MRRIRPQSIGPWVFFRRRFQFRAWHVKLRECYEMPEVGTGTPSDVRFCWRWNDRSAPLCKPKTNPSSIRSISTTCNRESSTAFDYVSKRLLNLILRRRCGRSGANSAMKESVVPMNSTVLIQWQPGSFLRCERSCCKSVVP